jgi:hypothetical protein
MASILASVNTFTKGMVQDLDKSYMSKEHYLEARNFRLNTRTGESAGALENIEGNNLMHSVATSITPAGYTIIGAVNVRDTMVAFITNNTNSRIITFTINTTTETIGSVTTKYDDALNGGVGTLGFNTTYPIKAVAVYESPTIQKVYWTDGYNNVRYCNIVANLTTDGEVYNGGTNTYMSPDKFEFLPKFLPNKPTLSNIVGGDVNTGVIAYSYQLYKVNGSTTGYSPLSDPIHVTLDSDFLTNTLLYKGSEETVSSGKGFVIQIDNSLNLGFDRLRLIRVHYSSLNSIPTITVTNEIEISPLGGTIKITDVGGVVNTLTIDEFNISSTELFSCMDLTVKDNRLFVANITKSEFTCNTFDARAIRFKSTGVADLYDSSDNYVAPIQVTTPVFPNSLASWNIAGWSNYTEEHDGVNIYNDAYDHDGDADNTKCKFQSDGLTDGAEGPNIKIDFCTELIGLDTSLDNTTFYSQVNTVGSNLSYTNYASPWNSGKLSWQRDEVYRLFVVFGNDRGQTAEPKWICDLRIPSLHNNNFRDSDNTLHHPSILAAEDGFGNIATISIFPRILFKAFPSNATWAQIHRVKREREDKSVITQGYAVPSVLDGGTGKYYPRTCDVVLPNNGELIKLVSPEINITKSISLRAGDYIEYATNYTGAGHIDTAEANNRGYIRKMLENNKVTYTAATRTLIDDAIMIIPSSTSTSSSTAIDGKEYINYNTNSGKGGSGLLIAYSDAAWSAEGVDQVIVNYKADVYGSQYGGHTYEERMNNISIPCSDIIHRTTDENIWIDIPYGDTYINYFDVCTILADLLQLDIDDAVTGTYSENLYVPLESSINCDLRHDKEARHFYPGAVSNDVLMRQEYAGNHTMATHGAFNQTTDLYLYNTVYSQQLDLKYAVSENIDVNTGTVFDCMVKVSNKKINSETLDSFSIFSVNNYTEVDTSYGPINALNTTNNKLLFWQENAFGVLSVNERSIVQDSNSAAIVLGTGGLLDRYDYLSDTSGTDSKFSVLKSPLGVYWFYPKDMCLYRFSSGLENISKSRMMQSWFLTNYPAHTNIRCVYDKKFNQVIYTFLDAGLTTGHTIVFDESMDAFTSFYDFVSRLYIPFNYGYMSVFNSTNVDLLYYHNSLLKEKCCFYSLTQAVTGAEPGTSSYVLSTIKVLFNDNYAYTKVFDTLTYVSTASLTDVEIYNNTFSSIRCYNNYQNTDYCNLTYGTNLERDEREWHTVVPRNAVNKTYITSPDIFAVANITKTRTFKERIRDKYMVTDFRYTNTSNRRFVVPYVICKYRISPR